jgi:hypothetical protein
MRRRRRRKDSDLSEKETLRMNERVSLAFSN